MIQVQYSRCLLEMKHLSTECAFPAVLKDGTVVTWGNKNVGGASSTVHPDLTGVGKVYSECVCCKVEGLDDSYLG